MLQEPPVIAGTNRVSPLPSEPVIVFSGSSQPGPVKALQAQRAEACMASFEYIRKNPSKFHSTLGVMFDTWPVRRYLDSGVFSLMRKAGVSNITIHHAKKGVQEDLVSAFKSLARDYFAYLRENHDQWDHIAELDVHAIPELGPEIALRARPILREIVGNKLLPVWHPEEGREGWHRLIETYPYVAVGSGVFGVKSSASANLHTTRTMAREAHAAGSLLHVMGSTKAELYLKGEIDSGDSITWISGQRYGRFSNQITHFSDKPSRVHGLADGSKSRGFIDFLVQHGFDPEEVITGGESSAKLQIAIILMLERQRDFREAFHLRRSESAHA